MPISPVDIELRLSGGSSNGDASLSIGGAKSSVAIVDSLYNNLFNNVVSQKAKDGYTNYRCIYIHNGHSELDLMNAAIFILQLTPSPNDEIDIGVGSSAVNATEPTIASETTAPAGVTFSRPILFGNALPLGTIAPDQHKAVWIRRTVSPNATYLTTNNFILQTLGYTLF